MRQDAANGHGLVPIVGILEIRAPIRPELRVKVDETVLAHTHGVHANHDLIR